MRKITPDKKTDSQKEKKLGKSRVLPRDVKALRQAIILKEILDRPICLRE